ncbi:hypothetical protein N7461_008447 [Penicillium sp. DV-2018c]|nr:hypothetical protein N7461_008447 [Penicillium sp. DV-2018c]
MATQASPPVSRKNRKDKSSGNSCSSGIHQVPLELLQLILAFLSVPDQICFALTCNFLLAAFKYFLEGKGLSLARLLPRGVRLALTPNFDERPRVKLLHQLEDDRWKYCADCWALHPAAACRAPKYRASHAISRSSRSANTISPICMPYAGEVTICPCRKITFPDKQYMMAELKHKTFASDLPRNRWYLECLCNHVCEVNGHAKYVIEAETFLWVSGDTRELHVLNLHTVNLRPVSTQPSTLPFTCDTMAKTPDHRIEDVLHLSKENVRKLLQSIYGGSGPSVARWNNSLLSQLASQVVTNWSDRGFEVSLIRNLGRGKWPDRNWAHHCH